MEEDYRQQHSNLNNLWYIVKHWFAWDPKGSALMFLAIPADVLLPILTAFLMKYFVDGVAQGESLNTLFYIIFSLVLTTVLITAFKHFIEIKQESFQLNISHHFSVKLMRKLAEMDYANLESYHCRRLLERCKDFAYQGAMADSAWVSSRLKNLLTAILGSFSYAALLTLVHPALLLVILLSTAIEFWISKRLINEGNKTEDEMADSNMQISYFYRVAKSPSFGKDIRIYQASPWLMSYLDEATSLYKKAIARYTRAASIANAKKAICWFIRDAFTFYFVISAVMSEKITAGDFLFYMALVLGFSQWLNAVAGDIACIKRVCMECDRFRSFIDFPDEITGGQTVDFDEISSIEFENVSFAYPDGEVILKDINLRIEGGQNIALVGENGAGKSTLIKLLCGFYRPSQGTIKVNGQDINQFNKQSYFHLFSVLFQDFMILPTSIEENVAMSEHSSRSEVWHALDLAGLKKKVQSLPSGLEEKLIKQVNRSATNLSGGETQRMLLARAICRQAPILILDEPSSALDPLAEEQLYLKYHQVSKNRTSIYISHRLTSTQFCDQIYLIDDGKIIEKGRHAELLSTSGKYKELFDLQAKYYRSTSMEVENNERF